MSWQLIWSAWNKFYFEKFQAHPRSILDGALGFLDEYQSSEARGCTPKLLILFDFRLLRYYLYYVSSMLFFFFLGSFFQLLLSFPYLALRSKFLLRILSVINIISVFYLKKKLGERIIVFFFNKKNEVLK